MTAFTPHCTPHTPLHRTLSYTPHTPLHTAHSATHRTLPYTPHTPLHTAHSPTHHTLPYTPHALRETYMRRTVPRRSWPAVPTSLPLPPPPPHSSPPGAGALGSGRVSGSKSNCHLPPVEDGNSKSDSDTIFKITTHHRCGGGRLGRRACSSPPTILPQFPVRVRNCKVDYY